MKQSPVAMLVAALLLPMLSTSGWSQNSASDAFLSQVVWSGDGKLRDSADLESAHLWYSLGDPALALTALEQGEVPDSAGKGWAAALRGWSWAAQGQHARAAAHFIRAAAHSEGRWRGAYLSRGALSLEAAGERLRASRLFLGAAAEIPAISAWLELRAAAADPDPASAIRTMKRVTAPVPRYEMAVRARLLVNLGSVTRGADLLAQSGQGIEAARVALAAGDSLGARRYLFETVGGADTVDLDEALELAETALPPRSPSEHRSLGEAHRRRRDYRRAEAEFRAAVSKGDSSPGTLNLWGETLHRLRQRRSALEAFDRASISGRPEAVRARFLRARQLLRLGRRTEAAEAFIEFGKNHPEHPLAGSAGLFAADLLRQSDRLSEAMDLLRNLAAREASGRTGRAALTRLARLSLEVADTAHALESLQEAARGSGSVANQARWELADLYRRMNRMHDHDRVLAEIARVDSLGYLGLIARRSLGLPRPDFSLSPDLPPAPRVDSMLNALDLLERAGLDREARFYLNHLLEETDLTPQEMLTLGAGLAERGKPHLMIRLGWRAAGELTLNHPAVVRAVFPWPLREMVEAEADRSQLDPYLLAALIRQESSFLPEVRSRAGAVGLMQLMPATARQVARREGLEWDERLLRIPAANLRLGTSHLEALMRRFDGNLVYVLAAYNAGGGALNRWLRRSVAEDSLEFLEEIPYPETRGYVKAVLRNLDVYRALYPERP